MESKAGHLGGIWGGEGVGCGYVCLVGHIVEIGICDSKPKQSRTEFDLRRFIAVRGVLIKVCGVKPGWRKSKSLTESKGQYEAHNKQLSERLQLQTTNGVNIARASNPSALNLFGLEELNKRWGWFIGLGILLIVLGTIALGASAVMTLATMVFIGWLMIVGGVMQAVHAWTCKGWSGFFLDLLTGILYTVAGFMIVANPGASAVTLTLLISMFLIFGGIFRIVAAVAVRSQNWGWVLLHGVVNLLLGIAIWQQWPLSGLWVIGLFLGIDMVFNGWSLVMLGLAARNLPASENKGVTGE